ATLTGLFLLLVGGGVGLPLPEDLTLLAAGVLAHQHVLRLRGVIAVGFAGVVCADWIIYLAGRRYGQGIVALPVLARLFGAARLDAVRSAVARPGGRGAGPASVRELRALDQVLVPVEPQQRHAARSDPELPRHVVGRRTPRPHAPLVDPPQVVPGADGDAVGARVSIWWGEN